jgi:hypothetical protein
MIEAFFRSLKHNFLFLLPLSSVGVVKRHVDFYCQQHNDVIPHSAFKGATPQEVYLGKWNSIVEKSIPHELELARIKRIEYHHSLERCSICNH